MATLAYPLRQNRSVAASMISCRRFDGRVPRAGRTPAFCTGPAVISPLLSDGFEALDAFANQETWLVVLPQYFIRSSRLRILPAPDIGMASTKSTLRGAL